MKVKLTRKMLCAVLSLVMVLTSLPLATFAAADGTVAARLKDAIDSYESVMDGTVYKSGMSDAYNSYKSAVEKYDKYVYGAAGTVSDSQATGAAQDLENKTLLMTGEFDSAANEGNGAYKNVWTLPAPNYVRPDFAGGGMDEACYQNIIYAPAINPDKNTATPIDGYAASTNNANAEAYIYFPEAVVIYDGINTPKVPVAAKGSRTKNKTRYIYAMYPCRGANTYTNSTDVTLPGYWHGGAGGDNLDFGYIWGVTSASPAYSYNTGVKGIQSTSHRSLSLDNNVGYANYMQVITNMEHEQYSKAITPYWYVGTGDSPNSDVATAESTHSIYMINYKSLTEEVDANTQKLNIGVTDYYAAGGLQSAITAYEAAAAFNINEVDFSTGVSGKVTETANTISNIIKGLKDAEKTPDTSIQALRDAIDANRARYELYTTGGDDPYEVFDRDSWDGFVKLYKKAQGLVDSVVDAHYKYSDMATVNDTAAQLSAYVVETKSAKVDTTLLEVLINNADYILSDIEYFNLTKKVSDGEQINEVTITKEQIESAVNKAKTDVWGSAGQYLMDEYKLDDTEQNQQTVFQDVLDIAYFIRDLEIDPNAVVSYASCTHYPEGTSLNTAIAEGEAREQDSSSFANFPAFKQVLDSARGYLAEDNNANNLTEPGRENAARDLVNLYKEIVAGLVDAIHSLTPAFSSSANGQRASAGTQTTTTATLSNYATLNFSFARNTGGVYFRTKPEAVDINLGRATLSFDESSNPNYWQLIDSLNFSAAYGANNIINDSINETSTAQVVWQEDNENDVTLSDSAGEYVGNLNADANDGATFKISDITGSVRSESLFGKIGGQNTDDENADFDTALKTTTGHNDSGILSKGSTVFAAAYTLSVPEYTTVPTFENGMLTANTKLGTKTYSLKANLGFVARYRYRYSKSAQYHHGSVYGSAVQPYEQTAVIIDCVPLFALVDECDKLDSTKYTTSTYAKLVEASTAAEAELNYWTMSTDKILSALQERYDALWNAYAGLKKRAVSATTWETDESGDPIPNGDGDSRYQYEIDHQGYSDARYDLFLDIQYNYYTYESLQKLAEYFENESEFKYLKAYLEQGDAAFFDVSEDEQAALDAEIQKFLDCIGGENRILEVADRSAYDAANEMVHSLNLDAYDINSIMPELDESKARQYVMVNGTSVAGYDYNHLTENIETTVNSNQWGYTVAVHDGSGNTQYLKKSVDGGSFEYVNDKPTQPEDLFHYGDLVTAANPASSGSNCNWSAEVTAHSTQQTQVKRLMTTGASYTFNVRGNTELWTDAASGGSTFKITFIDSRNGNVVAYDYATAGQYDLSKAPVPKRQFCSISSYTVIADGEDGAKYGASSEIEISKDTTLRIDYTELAKKQYQIHLVYSSGEEVQGYPKTVDYNTIVTLNRPSTAAYVDYNNESHILAYGSTYSFYACEEVKIRPVSAKELERIEPDGQKVHVSAISAPVVSEKRAQFIGSFAKPDSLTIAQNAKTSNIESFGIILNASRSDIEGLNLGDIDKSKNILNLSAATSTLMFNNQFAVSIGYGALVPLHVQYVAYVIYTDEHGFKQIVYSEPKTAELS